MNCMYVLYIKQSKLYMALTLSMLGWGACAYGAMNGKWDFTVSESKACSIMGILDSKIILSIYVNMLRRGTIFSSTSKNSFKFAILSKDLMISLWSWWLLYVLLTSICIIRPVGPPTYQKSRHITHITKLVSLCCTLVKVLCNLSVGIKNIAYAQDKQLESSPGSTKIKPLPD